MAETTPAFDTPATPPPAPSAPRRRKFWLGYLLSVLGLAGACLCVVVFVLGILATVSRASQQRALMPGEAEFELEAGHYVINYDHVSHIDGRSFRSPPLSDRSAVSCRLVHVETGRELSLSPTATKSTYSMTYMDEHYSGVTLLKVTVDEPGRYKLYGEPLPGADAAKPYVLALSKGGFLKGILVGVLTVFVGFALGLAGLAGLIVTIILHVIHRKKRRAYVPAL